MDGIDIGLFEFDRHNALYYFILNADEQIYMRYGGRDSASASTYLDLRSLELALEQGLDLHESYQAGEWAGTSRPDPLFPHDLRLVNEHVIQRNRCVECHLVADFRNLEREQTGELDKLTHMFRSPDIKALGIELDVPRGLVIKEATGSAAAAGVRGGDRITHWNGQLVWTFADVQYQYDRLPRDAQRLLISISRDGHRVDTDIELPGQWWRTDLDYRIWSIDPYLYFSSRPLSAEEKRAHGLVADGFASEVVDIDDAKPLLGEHWIEIGDIIFAVDGETSDDLADSVDLHIKLRKSAGSTVTLDVLRAGEKMQMKHTTNRLRFRK